MGSVTVLLLPFMPLIYLLMLLGNLFGVSVGINVTEVALPYNEETGLVWECEETDYGWFELTETRIEGDTQIFVFEAETGESHCKEVVFTAQNGEELVYYGRDDGPIFPIYGKVRFYSPDDYVIEKIEADGKTTYRVLCLENSTFEHCYSYKVRGSDGHPIVIEDVLVYYKNIEGKGLEIEETRYFYSQNLPQ